MNKYLKIASVVAVVAVVALVGAAVAFAQTPTPPTGGFGPGSMMGGGRRGPMAGGQGFMAEYQAVMHAKIAEALGLTADEFNAALAEGKTPYVIAQEKGIDFATVQAAMQAAHAEVLQQAVADGKLTQEQANWMLSRQAQMGAQRANGGFAGPLGQMGRGARIGGYSGNCPYTTTP